MNPAHSVTVYDFFELTKPRICLLALMMSALGFFWGCSQFPPMVNKFFFTLLGTGLVGAAAGALNQYMERTVDAQMWRTMKRPIPSGRLPSRQVLSFGLVLAVLGEGILLFAVNPLTAVFGSVTLLFYLGIYTPSKPMTSTSTLIGAIPGALPPVMGWTAATGHLGSWAFLLFMIIFIWQIPHFLAIAYMHREDYARASLPVLSISEENRNAGKYIIVYTLVLLPLTLLPTFWGATGRVYFVGTLLAGVALLTAGIRLAIHPKYSHAKNLFIVSILYLPLLAILMVWDRVH